ncbi:sensor histidine kinase [Nocardia sp. NPDC088792]|uniref:sensor histidine kinase n=1 Tax=Nocardia sp. NPDC088792 TaxID=3364332 RepID=UPI0037FB67D1
MSVVLDCVNSLDVGLPVSVRDDGVLFKERDEVRSNSGSRLGSSVQAATLLYEIIVEELYEIDESSPIHSAEWNAVLVALGRSMFLRLEAGVNAYDSFLLNQIGELYDSVRSRLARDLHDRLGSSLSVSMRQLETYVRTGDADCLEIRSVIGTLSEAIVQISDLITDLRLREDGQSLRSALGAFVAVMGSPPPEIEIDVNGPEQWVGRGVLDEIFLILRECLRNVYSHACARRAIVTVDITPREIVALVADDGIGFELSKTRRSNGLQSMVERAEILSGSVTVDSAPNRGTRIHIRVPIRPVFG